MKKIFKYKYCPISKTAVMPLDAQILRVDHVDDGFYKGDFVWAIVEVGDENIEKVIESAPKQIPITDFPNIVELRVKEKQIINTMGYPCGAGEIDGKIYIGCVGDLEHESTIAVYKTGQEIDLPVEKLVYLGLNRLWIIQELGLYTFFVLS